MRAKPKSEDRLGRWHDLAKRSGKVRAAAEQGVIAPHAFWSQVTGRSLDALLLLHPLGALACEAIGAGTGNRQ